MYSTIVSGAVYGINSYLVSVEVDIANGLPGIDMVGSLSSEVKEAKERVRVALNNSGFALPASHITINLSPANVRKDGSAFDLPIAVGILKSMEKIKICEAMKNALFIGELGLGGDVRFSKGILPVILEAKRKGILHCFVPYANRQEAQVVDEVIIHGVHHGDPRRLPEWGGERVHRHRRKDHPARRIREHDADSIHRTVFLR